MGRHAYARLSLTRAGDGKLTLAVVVKPLFGDPRDYKGAKLTNGIGPNFEPSY